ncbi:TonB-dependent receptor [Pelobium manganitolerans]|uniref:TonB-dependent receptor n=1 Tax=Pelobium manganitolerans TaxID=1842495 RepID=UPI003FA3CE0E
MIYTYKSVRPINGLTTILLVATLISLTAKAQSLTDSTLRLKPVVVSAYLSENKLFNLPSTVTALSKTQIEQNQGTSLLPVLNTVAGVKMEERSPGSYRLSIRGSLLRSPFGVRNVKVYFDGLPLTDASGNTYLNLIDQTALGSIEILKGPDGSLFGANSGGVVLLSSQNPKQEINVNGSFGSYGFYRENVHLHKKHQRYQYTLNQAYQYSDGYREQSLMKRWYFQTQQQLQYTSKANIKFSGFYSDLKYQTPGGLTEKQASENPRQARPATASAPGAKEQQAGIYNRSFFGGLTHFYQLSKSWQHHISLSGMSTDFENPFITNYEKRDENSLALRTFFSHQHNYKNSLSYSLNVGYEYQHSRFKIRNYDNNGGVEGNILNADLIKNETQFLFARFKTEISKRLTAEISGSLNFNKFDFNALPESNNQQGYGSVKSDPELMPRMALSYLFTENNAFRAIISRGYASPTKDEIRASDATINPDLKAEKGWNYEIGFRTKTSSERFYLDIAAFYYRLNDAIVRRVAANDEDYYVNAGGTKQKGLEIELNANLWNGASLFKKADWRMASTFSNFKFRDYIIGNENYSDNRLTGVPKSTFSQSLEIALPQNLNLGVQHYYQAKTSLNDAETVFAKSYHLLNANLIWNKKLKQTSLNIRLSANNISNVSYSLGNDLNAFGGRYFNPAAKRNFSFGLGLSL